MKTIADLIGRLSSGGSLVCTGECSELEIAQARACNRMVVDPETNLGYIYRPPIKEEKVESLSTTKELSVTSSKDLKAKVNDVEIFGDPDTWVLLCKANSKSQGWMKSTKVMDIADVGCLVQVTTQQGDNVAESIEFVPDVKLFRNKKGNLVLGHRNLNY